MNDSVQSSPVTPVGINHLVLNVRDIEAPHRFGGDDEVRDHRRLARCHAQLVFGATLIMINFVFAPTAG